MIYPDQLETTDLISLLKNKNQESFSALYDSYSRALYGVTFKMVQDSDVAKDILQEVFIKIWNHSDKYDSHKGTLFNWMLNITRNSCRDYFRSKHYCIQKLVSENSLEKVNIGNNDFYLTYQEENGELYGLTQSLDTKYKEIIDLVYIYGYSQQEVSQMLNLPLGTVKTRSRTAIKILRELYN
jgi:RNA polymerase sigma-70 factor (ECF subfamily)